MYLVNYLLHTDKFYPAFEIIFGIELLFIVLTIVVGIIVITLSCKAVTLHRLVRLRVAFPIVFALFHAASQVVVIHEEHFGPSVHAETTPWIIASLIKQFFFGYMTLIAFIVALDRWVATKAWSWYESGARSTLLFFLLQELIICSISATIAILYVFDNITAFGSYYCFAGQGITGAICFFFVFRCNLSEMRELKKGAVINKYCVAKIYQIKENISVLKSYIQIARPLIAVGAPPFIFILVYMVVPPNVGLDGLRLFSAALFELWLTIASFVMICLVPCYFPQLTRPMEKFSKRGSSIAPIAEIEKNTPEAGDAYFTMLAREWA
ncbi:hypothetical protein PRIPAC_80105 [Pristionchus pacificus]|uniref:G protein-coupled receptor n=1 Tax=Pristionchus pacificus TaxID=54126 RepID=A0A2A6CMK4_PRIPA|nr:hypothetical protein PRIPAC_80105 [Pristionchus pacificus]|eukprot:PDM79336.1 G protein-coupled receptor [Pristionchus pacificus]